MTQRAWTWIILLIVAVALGVFGLPILGILIFFRNDIFEWLGG
ncbi:MAG: hypothetical protein ACOCYE_14410 [Pseudomonadota bacterium]